MQKVWSLQKKTEARLAIAWRRDEGPVVMGLPFRLSQERTQSGKTALACVLGRKRIGTNQHFLNRLFTTYCFWCTPRWGQSADPSPTHPRNPIS